MKDKEKESLFTLEEIILFIYKEKIEQENISFEEEKNKIRNFDYDNHLIGSSRLNKTVYFLYILYNIYHSTYNEKNEFQYFPLKDLFVEPIYASNWGPTLSNKFSKKHFKNETENFILPAFKLIEDIKKGEKVFTEEQIIIINFIKQIIKLVNETGDFSLVDKSLEDTTVKNAIKSKDKINREDIVFDLKNYWQ